MASILQCRARHANEPSARALALPDKPSIAVLPFLNLSGDPEQEYFADGVVEDIISALSRIRWLFVIARNSSFTYKGRAVDVKQVGRELGVRYVLEGSVRKAANRVRITGQLIDATTGAHLWADRFEGTLDNIFELQDQLTENVVGAIAPQLERAEIERAKRKPTDSLDAYDYYLRGMANLHRGTRDAIDEALAQFYHTLQLDPNFASAYAMAAWCYLWRKANGWMTDRPQEIAEGARLARRAVELTPAARRSVSALEPTVRPRDRTSLSSFVSIAEAPGLPLGVPGKRPIPEHLGQPQPLRLPPVEDRLDNVRRQAGERQEPADVGVRDALLLRKVGDRLRLPALDLPPPAVRAHERLDQRLVAARLRRRHRRALRRHDQLPAAPALQPDRDADGQGIDLESRALGHYSAASSKGSDAAGAGASWSASSATRLRIPAACSVTEMPSGATSIRSINSRRMRACSAG